MRLLRRTNAGMPKRSPGQKLIAVPMSEEFIDHVNMAVRTLNYSDRAKLIRDAIAEKLEKEGIPTPQHLAVAPARVTKSAMAASGPPKRRRS